MTAGLGSVKEVFAVKLIFIGAARFLALAVLFACACLAGRAGEKTLHIYTWSDYFDPEVLRMFEDAENCRVAVDYFDSNEAMYAKLKAGAGGYDIITPSSYMSGIMSRQGMLQEIDHALLPNIGNIDANFSAYTEDPGMRFSVPYTRTVSGVGYNAKRVAADALGTWGIFGDSRYARRMTMLNDMRETIGAALKHLGHSLNSVDAEELAKAGDVLVEWKRNLAKFDVDEAKIGLGSGEFLVIHAYNGDVALIMDENPDIGFYIPEEGSSLAADDFVIPAGARQRELAHAFIDFLLDPEIAALNMEGIRYYMPNPAAVELLGDDLRNNPAFNVPEEAIAKSEVIRDLGEDNAKYIRVWDRVKAAE